MVVMGVKEMVMGCVVQGAMGVVWGWVGAISVVRGNRGVIWVMEVIGGDMGVMGFGKEGDEVGLMGVMREMGVMGVIGCDRGGDWWKEVMVIMGAMGMMGMAGYEFPELSEMIMCYGEARGNGRRALRIYEQWFPDIIHTTPCTRDCISTFVTRGRFVHGTLEPYDATCEHLRSMKRCFRESSTKSAGSGPGRLRTSCSVCPVVTSTDIAKPAFTSSILFSDELCFTRHSYFNNRNSHIWAAENPHSRFIHGHQVKFSVNIWAVIVGGNVLDPVIMPLRLNGAAYLDFLQNTLPLVLEDVPLVIRRDLTSEQHLQGALDRARGTCCIATTIPRPNSHGSLSLGNVKSVVYSTPVATRQELVERIFAACDQLLQRPNIFASSAANNTAYEYGGYFATNVLRWTRLLLREKCFWKCRMVGCRFFSPKWVERVKSDGCNKRSMMLRERGETSGAPHISANHMLMATALPDLKVTSRHCLLEFDSHCGDVPSAVWFREDTLTTFCENKYCAYIRIPTLLLLMEETGLLTSAELSALRPAQLPRRNAMAGETIAPRENPLTIGNVHQVSHLRKPVFYPTRNRTPACHSWKITGCPPFLPKSRSGPVARVIQSGAALAQWVENPIRGLSSSVAREPNSGAAVVQWVENPIMCCWVASWLKAVAVYGRCNANQEVAIVFTSTHRSDHDPTFEHVYEPCYQTTSGSYEVVFTTGWFTGSDFAPFVTPSYWNREKGLAEVYRLFLETLPLHVIKRHRATLRSRLHTRAEVTGSLAGATDRTPRILQAFVRDENTYIEVSGRAGRVWLPVTVKKKKALSVHECRIEPAIPRGWFRLHVLFPFNTGKHIDKRKVVVGMQYLVGIYRARKDDEAYRSKEEGQCWRGFRRSRTSWTSVIGLVVSHNMTTSDMCDFRHDSGSLAPDSGHKDTKIPLEEAVYVHDRSRCFWPPHSMSATTADNQNGRHPQLVTK
ncbi:hypothetical protein PR048_029393 [Dryococelus australis]|uniref:6-pyruvoyltetrahydropterin synthase n=1 Tax=Dryococelus australis TaxID=614101 RepID=A0ABQ9GFS2_9NEOP|nr:hypothetical protein PR048_029393 [Dryococelus australis]